MKNPALLFVTLLLLTSSFAAAADAQERPPAPPSAPLSAERDPRAWREFASAEGRFAVTLPGEPGLNVRQMPMPDGTAIPLHIHMLLTSFEYGVIYADYPFEVKGAEMQKRLLDDGARGAVTSVKARLLDLKEVSLGGHPGRALRELMPDGRVMHVRLYVVGSRLYQVAVTLPKLGEAAPEAAFAEEAAAKFLDSFRLLEGASGEGEVDRFVKALREKGEPLYGVPAGAKAAESDWVVSKPQPEYPPVARAARAEGTVVVSIVVDEEGRVVAAQAKSGHPLLHAAAVKAAREARFKPARVAGKPVKFGGVVSYNFVMQ